jgi:hypothetical protein
MRPMNAYKDMLDNVVSPFTCVSMNHQNQLEQMGNGACSLQYFLILPHNNGCGLGVPFACLLLCLGTRGEHLLAPRPTGAGPSIYFFR